MYRATVSTNSRNAVARQRLRHHQNYAIGIKRNVEDDLYPEFSFSCSGRDVGDYFSRTIVAVPHLDPCDYEAVIGHESFPTLAEALAFKLTHEGPEFEIEITEVVDV